jgi:hypothetical protein
MTTSRSTVGASTGGRAPGIPPGRSDLHPQTGVNAAEAELTMRLASIAPVREAARPRLVELLQQVDIRAYTALLAERRLLSLLGSRAIGLAPGVADDVLRSRVEGARREARLRAQSRSPILSSRTRMRTRSRP